MIWNSPVKPLAKAEIDAQLLATSRRTLGSNLDSLQKTMIREGFLHALQARLNEDREPAE